MEQNERKLIDINIDVLTKFTVYQELVNKCQQKELLSAVMVRNIEEDAGSDEKERHKRLFRKITERGPTAFGKLSDICKECGFSFAYQVLNPSSYSGHEIDLGVKKLETTSNKENRPPRRTGITELPVPNIFDKVHKVVTREDKPQQVIKLQPYTEDVKSIFSVKKAKKILKHASDDIPLGTYEMHSNHRGILFLVNIIEFHNNAEERRNGANIDKDSLIDVFRQMGFKVFYYENLRRDEFDQLVNQLSRSEYLRKPECLVFALLTHGNMVGSKAVVTFSDGGLYEVERIIERFSNVDCDYMLGRPKIFLFPFCRGDAPDGGFRTQVIRKTSNRIQFDAIEIVEEKFPSYSDIAICYATVPGFQTHRDVVEGSWYIQKFCSVLAEYSHVATFEQMLKKIDEEVSKMESAGGTVQTSSFESRGFNKVLFFNPGMTKSGESSSAETS